LEGGSEETLDAPITPDKPTRPASIYFTTFLGLAVGFSILLRPLGSLLNSLLESTGMSKYGCWSLINIAYQLLATAVILGIVVAIERKPLSSVGLRRPTLSDLGLGLALFVAVEIAGAVFRLLLVFFFPNSMSNVASCQLNSFSSVPAGLGLFVAAAAGISEEIAARGFAIDRLRIVSGRLGLAAAVALALDLAEHIPYWGWRYAIEIAPMQLLFVLMYLWRKDIMACIIGHFLTDALPFMIPLAMAGVVSLSGFGNMHEMEAARDYQRGDNASAIAEYTRALKSKPNDPQLLKRRASVETENRDYVAAIGDLNKVLSLDPKAPDPDALMSRAMAYYYAGYPEKGQPDADQAIALSPKDAELYKNRADIDEERDKPDAAISDLSQAIKYSKQKDEDLYYRRGWYYEANADYDKAIDDYNEAAKLDSSDTRIFRQRAEVYARTGQLDLAAADLARIKTSSTEDFIARAEIHEDEGNYALALEDYNHAIAEAGNDWKAANDAAWLLSTCPDAKVRDGKRALALAKKACDSSGWQDGDVLDTLAAALAETGDFAQAVTWQERSIELSKAQSPSADEQKEAEERLDLYRKGQPYRQPPTKK
jgi:tetratricopeptide (TPR) repeat protein/membrane protease YdiL (CAAX protease family)